MVSVNHFYFFNDVIKKKCVFIYDFCIILFLFLNQDLKNHEVFPHNPLLKLILYILYSL